MTRITKLLPFAILLSVLFSVTAHAATYTAASCNYSDVNAVINGPTHTAVDGDVIQIPAGSCTWSSGITMPSNIGITILGSGTPDSSSSTYQPNSSCASGTTITFNGVRGFATTPIYGNAITRISCMTLKADSTNSGMAFSILGTCTISGCPQFRVDNITFTNWATTGHVGNAYGISAVADMFGVFDHNNANRDPNDNPVQLAEVGLGSYLAQGGYGDYVWSLPESYGTANNIFFENNTFTDVACCDNESGILSTLRTGDNGGPRVVMRYNQITSSNSFSLEWHGTESNGRSRGGRVFEFYGNTVTLLAATAQDVVVAPRSGTGLVWGNILNRPSNTSLNYWVKLETQRLWGNSNTNWGPCDGSSVWDINDVTPSSPAWSGTISSVSGAGGYSGFDVTMSCSPSCGWTTNQWSPHGAPYSIHDTTQGGSEGTGSEIRSNTANSVHVITNLGQSGSWTPAAGDSVMITRALACIDQAGGRGAGYYYMNTAPATPAVSSNEAISPTYDWLDTFNGTLPSFGSVGADNLHVIENRDYYTDIAGGGNTGNGVGHGTLVSRPTTCTAGPGGNTPGVAYWATDQNTLYVCNPTNTWTAYYTPYTYPHPLTDGTLPNPPTNLTATPQ